jgi:hypothetical protein
MTMNSEILNQAKTESIRDAVNVVAKALKDLKNLMKLSQIKRFIVPNGKNETEKKGYNKVEVGMKEILSEQERNLLSQQENIFQLNKERKNLRQRSSEWDKNNPEKRRVHDRTMYAVETGKLIRPGFCSECKKECTPHAHHEDYSKPYDVMWLCSYCHFKLHHKYKHYRERTSEKTSKEDAMFRPQEETLGDIQK